MRFGSGCNMYVIYKYLCVCLIRTKVKNIERKKEKKGEETLYNM